MHRATYQKHCRRYLYLTLWSVYRDNVGGHLLVREANVRVGLRFNVMDEDGFVTQKGTMIPPWNGDRLDDKVLVLQVCLATS